MTVSQVLASLRGVARRAFADWRRRPDDTNGATALAAFIAVRAAESHLLGQPVTRLPEGWQ